jgi:hypothetical protein
MFLLDNGTSHCLVKYAFGNTFMLKVKKDGNTLVLGNGNQVPTDMHIKVHVRYNNTIVQKNALSLSRWSTWNLNQA